MAESKSAALPLGDAPKRPLSLMPQEPLRNPDRATLDAKTLPQAIFGKNRFLEEVYIKQTETGQPGGSASP
jgi:hypothetical protein